MITLDNFRMGLYSTHLILGQCRLDYSQVLSVMKPDVMSDTILLVDDDVRVVSALQRSLYRDYRIEIAAGPADALDAIVRTSYAVVVSDLQMPGMNGIDLLTTVKEASPDTVR